MANGRKTTSSTTLESGGRFGQDAAGLSIILGLHAALALTFLWVVPPFNWPDEPAHFNYIRALSDGEGLAAMEESAWSPIQLEELKTRHFAGVGPQSEVISSFRYEAHQPPLFYALAAAVYRLVPSLGAIRILNLTLSCGVVLVTFFAGRRLFATTPEIAWGAALFSAVLPMRAFMSVSIGNGLAAELVFALLLLAVARGARPLAIGAILGVGLWVHAGLLLAVPFYAAWLVLNPAQELPVARALTARETWQRVLVAAVVGLVLWSPWLFRNVSLYGWADPLALSSGALGSAEAEIASSGEPRPTLSLAGPYGLARFAYLLVISFWGVFGWMEMFYSLRIQVFFLLLSAVGVVGLLREFGRGSITRVSSSLAVLPCLIGLALLGYSAFDFQPQGRYLHLASTAIALLHAAAGYGLFGNHARRWFLATSTALAAVGFYGALYVVPWYLAR